MGAEKLQVGKVCLNVDEKFTGIKDIVDEVIACVTLLGYRVGYHINNRQDMIEPYITICTKEEVIVLIEFGTNWSTKNIVHDVDIIVYEERFYLEADGDRMIYRSSNEFREYWDKLKLIL